MASTRERLLALHRSEPHLNQNELAERLGVSRQRVQQIVDGLREKGDIVLLSEGQRGIKPKRTTDEPAPAVTGGVPSIANTPPAVATLLTAADLVSRGYSVYLPYLQTSEVDLIAIDRAGRVERIVVRRARRAGPGGEVRYDDAVKAKHERTAMILTDERVSYQPSIDSKP